MTSQTRFEFLSLLLSIIVLLIIPLIITMIRGIVKWTRTEDKLNTLMRDVSQLVEDKDKTHTEILAQMREDRNATNRRLRWLEENVWKGRNNHR